jgi:hypothetical protein
MRHGADPFYVQMIRNQLELRRINAVHFFKHNLCRTPVDLIRASINPRDKFFFEEDGSPGQAR